MTNGDYHPVEGVNIELRDGVLRLELDRPQQRNALNDTMMAGLIEALDLAGRDDRVRVVQLAATGEHFCGGGDIVARNQAADERPRVGSIQRRLPSQAHRLIPLLCSIQVPVVCAVKGWAVGIGLQLVAAADFAVAATDSRFWAPFAARGFTPDSGATWLLPRLVGTIRARELLILGRELSGVEAVEWGLVHQVAPAHEVQSVADDLTARLAGGPTVTFGLTKWLLYRGAAVPLEEHLRNEAFALELSSRSGDFREGLAAFREGRPPDFQGR
jgi:2-(1,2-epoxy-1,2-dihydrophenyl)acetyl-CoA isomerase